MLSSARHELARYQRCRVRVLISNYNIARLYTVLYTICDREPPSPSVVPALRDDVRFG